MTDSPRQTRRCDRPGGRRRRPGWTRFAGFFVLACLAAGCSLLREGTNETTSMLQSFTGQRPAGATNAALALQLEVMREADEYVGAVAQATDDFRARVPTIEARNAGQQWKLMEATAAFINATGENPALNAVDMLVLATLSREVMETYWVGEKFGAAAEPMLQTHRRLETNAWRVVDRVLSRDQQQEMRELLLKYREQYPNMRFVAAARLPDLVASLGNAGNTPQARRNGSLFSLLYLNPLAGLDPATQAIEQTRNLAQRGMYYAQRAPMLLSWQVELTTFQLAVQPEALQVLSDVKNVAESSTVFAKTAIDFPQLVNDQREAAIAQLLAGVAAERTNVMAALNSQETQLRTLLPPVRETLNAGGDMANSVNGAVKSLDAFVRLVNPPQTNAPTAPTDSHPFNVLDYGKAASQIGAAAVELNSLLASANQSVPQAAQLGQQAGAEARAVVNHAFRLALVLIAAAGLVAVLVVWISQRILRPRER